jgi:hypothetical protein
MIGLAIVSSLDEILTRRTAEAADIHPPGAVCIVEQLDPETVPLAMIGRRFTPEVMAINKPPAPSIRRRSGGAARTA